MYGEVRKQGSSLFEWRRQKQQSFGGRRCFDNLCSLSLLLYRSRCLQTDQQGSVRLGLDNYTLRRRNSLLDRWFHRRMDISTAWMPGSISREDIEVLCTGWRYSCNSSFRNSRSMVSFPEVDVFRRFHATGNTRHLHKPWRWWGRTEAQAADDNTPSLNSLYCCVHMSANNFDLKTFLGPYSQRRRQFASSYVFSFAGLLCWKQPKYWTNFHNFFCAPFIYSSFDGDRSPTACNFLKKSAVEIIKP